MRRVEALADAFAKIYGCLDPLSECYKIRNPLMLKAFSPRHTRNDKGYRIFGSFIAGYENGVLDLKIKCSGKSRAKLTPKSPLLDLIHTYGQSTSTLPYLVRFLRHALDDETIPEGVEIGWFCQDLPAEDRYFVPSTEVLETRDRSMSQSCPGGA